MAQGSSAVLGRAARWTERSAITAMFAPLALLSSPALRRALIALALLDIPLVISGHLGWREADGNLGAVAGLEISITTLAILGLYVSSFLQSAASKERSSVPLPLRKSAPLLIWLGITTLSVLVASDKELAFFEIWQMAQLVLLYFYLINWTRTREQVLFIVRWLVIGFVLETAIIFVLAVIGQGFVIPGIRLRVDEDRGFGSALWSTRIGGTVGGPNGAGGYLAFLIPMVFGIAFTSLPQRTRRFCMIAAGLGASALVLTFSRGAWLAFAVSIFFLLFLAFQRTPATRVGAVLLLVLAVVLLLWTQNPISNRIFGEDRGAAQGRVPLMHLAGRMIADNPVLGVGDNNFTARMHDYIDRETRSEWLYLVHNHYLVVWSEIGTLGFLAYLWFLFQTVRRGWWCWKAADGILSPIALGFTAGMIGHLIHMFFDTFRGRTSLQLLLVAAALLLVTQYITDHQGAEQALPADGTGSHA